MKTCLLLMQRSSRLIAPFALLLSMLAPAGLHAQLMVDCSGADPNAFPTINSALPYVTPGSSDQVLRIGVAGDPLSAAIRVDGNSQALLRGGDISQNIGPALLALVNSSVDFTGVNFSGNTSGIITCDSTATMISDLARPETTPAAGVRCKTPHALRNRRVTKAQTSAPDLTAYRALQAKYRKVATRH
jgi:hypothetical protein